MDKKFVLWLVLLVISALATMCFLICTNIGTITGDSGVDSFLTLGNAIWFAVNLVFCVQHVRKK